MASYQPGITELASFSLELDDGKSVVHVTIRQKWQDIDLSSTVRCDASGTIEVEKKVGLTQRDAYTLSASISTSLGPEALAQIKSKVAAELNSEVRWETEYVVKKTFDLKAPKCGKRTDIIYQLVREYDVVVQTPRNFWRAAETWRRSFTESTNNYDAYPLVQEYDPLCGCNPPAKGTKFKDGVLSWDFGALSLRTSYRSQPNGIEAHAGDKKLLLAKNFLLTLPAPARVDTRSLPKYATFLGDISENIAVAYVSEYVEEQISQPELAAAALRILSFADEDNEEAEADAPRPVLDISDE